jgi:tetratricopeptide (TPR) repeat protein
VRLQQGHVAEALTTIQAALKLNPKSAEAWSNLGIAFGSLGRLPEALASYDNALAIKPDYPEALYNRGAALRDLKRPEDALASYGRAIVLRPDYVEALYNCGLVLKDLDHPKGALACYDRAIALKPNYAEAHNNRGAALQDLEQFDEALASYDQAIAIRPDFADAHNNRGAALQRLKRVEDALASCDAAIAIMPDFAQAHNNRGAALHDLNRSEEALKSYDRALAIRPAYPEALHGRGNTLRSLHRPQEALASYDRALELRPDYAEAVNNRGGACQELNRPEEALASCDRALALRPDYSEALNNRGFVLGKLKRPLEARASFDRALAIRPDYSEARLNRGLNALMMGDFATGWRDYESRWDVKGAPARNLVAPYSVWRGEAIEGKRVIVYEEQGLGDIIQISRFLPLIAARGAEVTFLVRSSMHRLLRAFSSSVRFVDKAPEGEVFDLQCALMSLPGAFGTSHQNLPSKVPYLFADEALVARWARSLGGDGAKIGICWQGNPNVRTEIDRSFPLRRLEPLAAMPGVRLISLQKADGLDQLHDLPSGMRIETLGADFDAGPDAFADTAAIMSLLDLVITADTSIAHLAGALGRSVWVALKHVPDWRWMLDRSDTPWYPTMSLYRQQVRGDWAGVFERIGADVARLSPRERSSAAASA